MKLRILGNPDRYLAPLSGGSSYLVTLGATRVLLDAGGGARDALAAAGVTRLDAVVLSHFHQDHVLDLATLRDAMDAHTTLVIPRGERRRLDALADAFAFEGPFGLDGPIVEQEELAIGGMRLRFATTQHSAPSMATRIDAGGESLVYASDTAPCDALRALSRGCDLLLAHTLLPALPEGQPHLKIHTTAETAARLAKEVGARKLVLSHRYHGSADADMLAHAPGATLAAPGATHAIRGSGRP